MNESAWDDEWGPWSAPALSRVKAAVKFVGACGWAAARAVARSPRGVPILTYHGTPADRSHVWWHDFAGQMALLEDLGYRVVPLADVAAFVRGQTPIGGKAVALTFDDGWRSNLDVAFPLLARRRWPATVFVPSGFLGRRPFVTRDELGEIAAMGFDIGNHTHSHPDVSTLDANALHEELRIGSETIGEIVGRAPRFFCYPYGRYDPLSRDLVAQFGFDGACSGRCATNVPGVDPYVLRRVVQEPQEGTAELRVRLRGGYAYLDVRQRGMEVPRRPASPENEASRSHAS